MKILTTSILTTLVLQASVSNADVKIEADLQGSLQVKSQEERHFRHTGSCYWEKKGPQLSDRGAQEAVLHGGSQSGGLGTMLWASAISHPFGREVRRLTLNTSQEGSKIILSLNDDYGFRDEQIGQTECGHTDGITRADQASIQGTIKIHYTVPEGVWAIKIDRTGEGIFQRANQRPVTGILNPGYDEAVAKHEYLWTEPGTVITQEIVIPKSIPGSTNPGRLTLIFEEIGEKVSDTGALTTELNELWEQMKDISALKNSSYPKLLKSMATLSRSPEALELVVKGMSTKGIMLFSRDLFDYAQAVNKDPQLGLPLKAMAAIAAYELSSQLLKEMSPYCDQVDVLLPISGKTVQTVGLRAAGFWLQRSLARVANYGWEHYEALLRELAIMESSGATYDQIMKNEPLRMKVNKASNVLIRSLDPSASPFRRSTKEVERTLQQFGSIGTDQQKTNALLERMKELGELEAKFVRQFFTTLRNFKHGNHSPISVGSLVKDLRKLQEGQKEISDQMTNNLRLLSVSEVPTSESAFAVMTDALSHQIGIFEKDVEGVPYFPAIRAAYVRKNERRALIDKIAKCVTLEELQ